MSIHGIFRRSANLEIIAVIAINISQYLTTCSLPDQGSKKSQLVVVVDTSSASKFNLTQTSYQQISITSTMQFGEIKSMSEFTNHMKALVRYIKSTKYDYSNKIKHLNELHESITGELAEASAPKLRLGASFENLR